MLLKRHIEHTKAALKAVDLNTLLGKAEATAAYEQILLGSQVNDLLEFTSEAGNILMNQIRLSDLQGAVGGKDSNGKKIQNLFYQSHWGQLASLHVMATKGNVAAMDTHNQLAMWWSFLQGYYLGKIKFNPSDSLAKTATPVQPIFNGLDQPFSRLFDTKVPKQIKYRCVGMLMHLIQDSYTPSHCFRTTDGKLGGFYCYDLQDSDKHSKGDDIAVDSKIGKVVQKQCITVLKALLAGEPTELYKILPLKRDAMSSYAGEGYAKK